MTRPGISRQWLPATFALAVFAAACGSPSDASNETVVPVETATNVSSVPAIVADEPIPEQRCEANANAGTITFSTSPDVAAAATIDVITAQVAGYYGDLCLDVEIQAGQASTNYELVASGEAHFAAGSSFSEMVAFGAANDADLLATTVEGRTTTDTLIVRAGDVTELNELAGSRIGVDGNLPPAIAVMLQNAGLTDGDDFETVSLAAADPVVQLELDIQALVGSKSNELGALNRAGVGVQQFDPLDVGVPGSFGVIFTAAEFVETHPTAAQDFVRATMRGLADAVAGPQAAAAGAVNAMLTDANSDVALLESEAFRWEVEASLILEGTPEGLGLGMPDPVELQAEVEAYANVGLFGNRPTPVATDFLATGITDGVYDDSVLAWPS